MIFNDFLVAGNGDVVGVANISCAEHLSECGKSFIEIGTNEVRQERAGRCALREMTAAETPFQNDLNQRRVEVPPLEFGLNSVFIDGVEEIHDVVANHVGVAEMSLSVVEDGNAFAESRDAGREVDEAFKVAKDSFLNKQGFFVWDKDVTRAAAAFWDIDFLILRVPVFDCVSKFVYIQGVTSPKKQKCYGNCRRVSRYGFFDSMGDRL